MSQLDTLQGPQVFLQPRTPTLYQEGQVYMPRPSVTIGYRGFDLDVLGKAGAKLGTEIIEAYNQEQVNKSASALQSLQNKTAQLVDQWSEVNDFDGVDLTYAEYKQAARDILGFDPEDEEAGSMLGPYGKIAASARSFNANVDASIAKSKRGWSDTISFDNYVTFSENENKAFIEADDKISAVNSRIDNLAKAYKDQTGVDITSPLPKSGFTVERRRLFAKMQKDYSELLEMKTKVETQKPEIETIGEQLRNTLNLSTSWSKRAKELSEQSSKILSDEKSTSEERLYAQSLRTQALQLATQAVDLRKQAMIRMLDPIKKAVAGEIVGPMPELSLPSYLDDPFSNEALQAVLQSGLSTEAGNAFINAAEADNDLLTSAIASDLRVVKAARTQQERELQQQVNLKLSEAERKLSAIDSEIKETATTPERRNMLMMKKVAIVNQLEKSIRDENILLTLPKDLRQKSPAWADLLSGINQENRRMSTLLDRDLPWLRVSSAISIANSPSMGFGIGFDVDSRNILAAAFGDKPNATIPLYDYSIEKLNTLKSKFFDSPGGNFRDLDRSTNDLRKAVSIAMGQTLPGETPPSSDEQAKASMNLAIRRLSATASMDENLIDIPFEEARAILEANRNSNTFAGNRIPFGVEQFIIHPWFNQMMSKADSMENQEEAKKYVQDTLDLFVTNAQGMPGKYSDYKPRGSEYFTSSTNSASVDILASYMADPQKNLDLNAMYLMIQPKNVRTAILQKAKERIPDGGMKASAMANIGYLEYLSNEYDNQQSVKNYLDSIKPSGITPMLLMDVSERMAVLKAAEKPSERTLTLDRIRKSNDLRDKEHGRLISFYFDNLPKFSQNLSIPGWTPEVAAQAANHYRLDDNLREVIVTNLLALSSKDKDGFYEFKDSTITEISRRINESLNRSKYVFTPEKGFQIDLTATVELPNGTTKTTIDDNIIMSSFGMPVPESHKARAIGLTGSFGYNKNATDAEARIHLSQVADSRDVTKREYDLLEKDPFNGLISYGVVKNKKITDTTLRQLGGASQADALRQLVQAATAGVPHDNLNVLASTAAISLLPPETTNIEDAKSFVSQTAARIRREIMDGEASNYSLDIVSTVSNDGRGQKRPTLVIKTGDKIISSLQLSDSSYKLTNGKPEEIFVDLFKLKDRKDLSFVSTEYSNESNSVKEAIKNKLAIEYLIKNPTESIPAGDKFGYGYGFDKQYFYQTRTNKSGDLEIIKVPRYTTMANVVPPRFYDPETVVVETIRSAKPTRTFLNEDSLSPLQSFVDSQVSAAMSQPSQAEREANTLLLNTSFGTREDGTPKGRGYLGPLVTPAGNIVTEYTIGVNLDGKEVDIPTLVPTLTAGEILSVLDAADNGDQPMESVITKAIEHARNKIANGQSVFFNEPTGAYAETEALIDEIQADMSEPLARLEMEFERMRQEGADLQGLSSRTIQTTTVTKPNTQFFDLQRALMRDVPPLFIDSPKKREMVPNPRFFNLGKSLMRDIPSFFTK